MSRRSRPHPFTDLEEAPRAGIEPKKIARRARMFRFLAWTSIILAPIALIGWISSLGASTGSESLSATSSPGRAAATEAVRSWLSADPSPLPGGEIISWDGATVRSTTTDPQTDVTVTVESNRFTVGVRRSATTTTTKATTTTTTEAKSSKGSKTTTTTSTTEPSAGSSEDGGATTTTTEFDPDDVVGTVWSSTYSVEVLVAVDGRAGAQVISAPSMIPTALPVDDGWAPTDPEWPGLEGANASEAVDAAVARWSEVYVLGTPEDLALATGDPDEERSYLPLELGDTPETVTAEVLGAATSGDAMVARVSLTFAWPAAAEGEDPLVSPRIDLDVLIERADTASPVVVAWGPPGSGPELEAYSNGYVGERSERQNATADTTSTTTTTAPPDDAGDGDGGGN